MVFECRFRDILFFRNRGATTTDRVLASLSNRVLDDKLIINDIRSFLNYDSKDRSFKIWNNNNLRCPDYLSFSLDEINKYSIINTNRLHGAIGGSLLNKHVKFYPNSYWKNQEVYNYSLRKNFPKTVFRIIPK